jgi:hypothetical protein
LSVVSVVCCQVEVSATDWSLVQRSPTDCDASLCVIKKPRTREAKARYRAVKIRPQWVVTSGQQTNMKTCPLSPGIHFFRWSYRKRTSSKFSLLTRIIYHIAALEVMFVIWHE